MIGIVKYNAGNIFSVKMALERLNVKYVVTDDKEELKNAEKIIFPGVGEAKSAMESLKEKNLDTFLPKLTQPFLGICLGMQLLFAESEEGDSKGLGIIDGKVKRFPENRNYKIPEIGWNNISIKKDDEIFRGVKDSSYFYFVHSYYAPLTPFTLSTTEYDELAFSSSVKKDNFYGFQFHPEKSGETGEKILKNFLGVL